MTFVVHDFSGHPFQAELSRRLAARGHRVEHLSAAQYVSGKGHLSRDADDSELLEFDSIELNLPFQKYAPWARLRWELAYGRAWVKRLRSQTPAAVIACNLPLISLWIFSRYATRAKLPWVFWHQDVYSFALSDELQRRFPAPLARLGSRILQKMEASIARSASHVVAIGEAFTDVYDCWKVDPSRVTVVPNWAPLDKIFPAERLNAQSDLLFPHNPDFRMVYAGTLGRKHNPGLLPELVEGLRGADVEASMAVVSEGDGADDVAQSTCAAAGHLTVVGFQPADDLPDVLGSADVLVALLEPDATKFSIPSKVLSYMAAGRPILGLMPYDNPAAADILSAGGFVVDPDAAGVCEATAWLTELAKDSARRQDIGLRTRTLAERQFDADDVAVTFENILDAAVAGPSSAPSAIVVSEPVATTQHLV